MPFHPTLAAIRFGTGLSPLHDAPPSAAAMMDTLLGPDLVAQALPIALWSQTRPTLAHIRDLTKARDEARKTDVPDIVEAAEARRRDAQQEMGAGIRLRLATTLARGVAAPDGFRERLLAFWASHFTVQAKGGQTRHLVTPFVEEAIRPHLTARFGDMLVAVVTHPMMLLYLDQTRSVGPNSQVGQRGRRGLNENLARELLELHTVGVDAGYVQKDVTQLAKLLAGLTFDAERGFSYDPRYAEPGAETVMGMTFLPSATLETVTQALHQLALHPATARHVAKRIAVHFVSDDPDPALVAALEARFTATDGDLGQVCAALLDHPAAWVPTRTLSRGKVKTPVGFLQSALRALAVPVQTLLDLDQKDGRRFMLRPLQAMGQPWESPAGPDGWPEDAGAWITPTGMAERINWAMAVPRQLVETLPDPRDFVHVALGPEAPAEVVFAAGASETQREGIGVILASAAFQRR